MTRLPFQNGDHLLDFPFSEPDRIALANPFEALVWRFIGFGSGRIILRAMSIYIWRGSNGVSVNV